MTVWIPIAAAAVAGIFAVFGYLLQKRLERRDTLSNQRREAYTMYFKTMFQRMDSRPEGSPPARADEAYWKTRVLLFASDEVVEKLGSLKELLTPTGPAEGREAQLLSAFDAVLLAMRREIVGKTKTTLEGIRKVSPILE